MPIGQVSSYELPDIEVVHDFIELAETRQAPEDDHASKVRFYDIAERLSSLVGLSVEAKWEPPSEESWPPAIEVCFRLINLDFNPPTEYSRTAIGLSGYYERQSLLPYRRQARGKIVGIDDERDALVVKPNKLSYMFLSTLRWVRVIDDEGQPLVGLSF